MKITMTKTIGIIVIIIAIITWAAKAQNATPLAIAGIILLIAPTKHGQQKLDQLTETITKWKTIITTALYDALYWLILFGTVYFYKWRLEARTATIQTSIPTKQELLMGTAGSPDVLKGLIIFMIGGAILALIVIILAYTLSRGMIWTTITNQKPTKKFFKKFLGLNLAWWAIMSVLFIFLATGMKTNPSLKAGLVGLMLVSTYFTVIIHSLYMKKHQIGYSLSNGVAWGIAKIHQLIIPYTLAFIIYVIAYQIFRLFQTTAYVQPVSMLFVILFIAWLRTYLNETIKQFK